MSNDELTRQRTFTWADPLLGFKESRHMSGLAYMQAIRDGVIPPPPIAELMGMTIAEVEAGRVVFTLVPHEYHYNPGGLVHGGVAATLCDSAMACALQTMLAQGMMYTTLELHVNYVRGMTTKTGLVRCTGEVIHQGRQMATAQSRLVDEQGRLYSHATTTCLIFPIPSDKNA